MLDLHLNDNIYFLYYPWKIIRFCKIAKNYFSLTSRFKKNEYFGM